MKTRTRLAALLTTGAMTASLALPGVAFGDGDKSYDDGGWR
jgi:hypothetical protein